jgi:hypothetical protein
MIFKTKWRGVARVFLIFFRAIMLRMIIAIFLYRRIIVVIKSTHPIPHPPRNAPWCPPRLIHIGSDRPGWDGTSEGMSESLQVKPRKKRAESKNKFTESQLWKKKLTKINALEDRRNV